MAAAAVAMTMAVGNLFICGFATGDNFYIKMQVLACQWVVHIHIHIKFTHFDNGARLDPIVGVDMDILACHQLAFMFKVLAGHALSILDIAQAIAFGGHHHKRQSGADIGFANRVFEPGDHLATAMEVNQWFVIVVG